MATGPSVAGPMNAYIPNWEASGKLRVAFSRNPNSFPVASYLKMVGTTKNTGYWKRWLGQAHARVIDDKRFAWPYGKPRPQPVENAMFEYVEFREKRRTFGYDFDQETVDQADEDTVAIERAGKAALCMTARTARVATLLTTTSNWATSADGNLSANHYSTSSAFGYGDLSAGSATDPRLFNTVNKIAEIITKDSLGIVSDVPATTSMIMNPTTARKLAGSQELVEYLKGSPSAYARIVGRLHRNAQFGLPEELFGHNLIIENTVKVTSERRATLAQSFAFPDDTIAIVTRYGDIDGHFNAANNTAGTDFSTATAFYKEDMTVEEFSDTKNRLLDGYVTEQIIEVLTCPATGYLLTSVFTD